jgi:hypothetical protein
MMGFATGMVSWRAGVAQFDALRSLASLAGMADRELACMPVAITPDIDSEAS